MLKHALKQQTHKAKKGGGVRWSCFGNFKVLKRRLNLFIHSNLFSKSSQLLVYTLTLRAQLSSSTIKADTIQNDAADVAQSTERYSLIVSSVAKDSGVNFDLGETETHVISTCSVYFSHCNSPTQVRPSKPNSKPLWHWQRWLPGRFMHWAWAPHEDKPSAHSSISAGTEEERKWGFYMNSWACKPGILDLRVACCMCLWVLKL